MSSGDVDGDVDIAVVGRLLADRARCRILLALADGLAAAHRGRTMNAYRRFDP